MVDDVALEVLICTGALILGSYLSTLKIYT